MLHAAPQQRGLLCSCGGPIRIHLSGSGLLPRTALFSVTVDATAIAAIPMPGGHSRHAVTVFFSMTRSKSVINFVFSLSDSHQSRANHVHNHKFHPRFLEFFEHYLDLFSIRIFGYKKYGHSPNPSAHRGGAGGQRWVTGAPRHHCGEGSCMVLRFWS